MYIVECVVLTYMGIYPWPFVDIYVLQFYSKTLFRSCFFYSVALVSHLLYELGETKMHLLNLIAPKYVIFINCVFNFSNCNTDSQWYVRFENELLLFLLLYTMRKSMYKMTLDM